MPILMLNNKFINPQLEKDLLKATEETNLNNTSVHFNVRIIFMFSLKNAIIIEN